MKSASRTLVKSPPELWELIDQPDRMQGLMCALVGRATEVTVNERRPETILRWEASDDGADAWIEVQHAEKGWGTNVKLRAENGHEATKLEGWLDAVLEELATPQKRPFEGMGEPPPEPVEVASTPEPVIKVREPEPDPAPAAVQAPDPGPPAAETPEPESPEPGTPEPETTAPMPLKQGKLRRFLGL